MSVSVSFAHAASLTSDQVSAILNLLKSFGAEQSVITNVEASLTGGTPSTSNNGQGRWDEGAWDDNRKWDNASSTPGIPGLGERRSDRAKCVLLNRNLSRGAQGDDVMDLQKLLKDEGEFDDMPTGFFGPITERALAMWQEHQGIASSTNGGIVGPMTRRFMDDRCHMMSPTASTTQQ